MAHKLETNGLESSLGNWVAYNLLRLLEKKKKGGVGSLHSIKVLNSFQFDKYLHRPIMH